jgi:hypothetical protein
MTTYTAAFLPILTVDDGRVDIDALAAAKHALHAAALTVLHG